MGSSEMDTSGVDSELWDETFRDLEEKARSVPIDASETTLHNFSKIIERSNELAQNARTTEQVLKDAFFYREVTDSIRESSKTIDAADSIFDADCFAQGIRDFVTEKGWKALADKAKAIFKYAPGLTYMVSHRNEVNLAQADNLTKKNVRQPKDKKVLEARKEPDKVKTITKTDVGVQIVEQIMRILKREYRRSGKPICFFKFVTDPKSFSKTVENIFHVSFLAKDGHVDMTLDENELPVLTPLSIEGQNAAAPNGGKAQTTQMLISISPDEWKEIVETFEITSAVIP